MSNPSTMHESNACGAPPAAWSLPRGQVRRLAPASQGRWLRSAAGRLWLTRSGGGAAREADVIVDAGASAWLPARSEWVIEAAWSDAAFLLLEPPPPARAA